MKRLDLPRLEHPSFIGCWDLEDPGLCEEIINFFEKNPSLNHVGRTNTKLDQIDKKTTDLTISPLDLEESKYAVLNKYMERLFECYTDYLAQWPFLGTIIPEVNIGRFNIKKYDPGGHFNKLHTERASLVDLHRVLVFMTYLNDVEDGGMTTFKHFDLGVKPEAGKTLIWPAEWTHAHVGEVVNSGSKYIVTGWMEFPFNE